jgi:hypothetical protein
MTHRKHRIIITISALMCLACNVVNAHAENSTFPLFISPAPEVVSQQTNAGPGQTWVTGEMWVQADGTIYGSARTITQGAAAQRMESFMQEVQAEGAHNAAIQLLRRQNMEGFATLSPAFPLDESRMAMDVSFTLNTRVEKDGSLRVPSQPGPRLAYMPQLRYIQALRDRMIPAGLCQTEHYEQKLLIHLPSGNVLEPAYLPDSVVNVPHARFRAQYSREGDRITITRILSIEGAAQPCTTEAVLDMAPAIRAAAREFGRTLLVRPSPP